MYELLISHNDTVYEPVVQSGVQWETQRKGTPGRLTFKVIKDNIINFTEGDPVRFSDGDTRVFYGFVFQKKRSKDNIITVTAYDQLRYLKNKDTLSYSNKTATEVTAMLAKDFYLNCGTLEDTSYKIDYRLEDNQTLFDVIQTALDLTLQAKKELYVLYDDCGKLTLKNIASMGVGILIDSDTGENFDYTTSIDGATYNQIKLIYENKDTGKREIYITKDSSNINEWGLLQYFEKLNTNTGAKAKADALLSLYNRKTRNLTVKGVFGDSRVRAGSMIAVRLNLGDVDVNQWFLVEKCTHKYSENYHTMDLSLRGGDFIA